MKLLLLKLANKFMDWLLWLTDKMPKPVQCIHGKYGKCIECTKDWHASGGW